MTVFYPSIDNAVYMMGLDCKNLITDLSSYVFLLAAINQFLNEKTNKKITILDFGGACGAHYFEISRYMPKNVNLKWYVIETEQMVKSAIEKGIENEELKFLSSIDKIKDNIDFVHSSCTLQYVLNPYEIIKSLINTNANWIFFNRTAIQL